MVENSQKSICHSPDFNGRSETNKEWTSHNVMLSHNLDRLTNQPTCLLLATVLQDHVLLLENKHDLNFFAGRNKHQFLNAAFLILQMKADAELMSTF